MFILQFALTFRFEIVPGMRTPIHYATLNNVSLQFRDREMSALPMVIAVYLAIDAVLIVIMVIRVRYSLPEKYRNVLYMYYYRDMTAQEIAYVVKKSTSVVYRRIREARQVLMELM